MKCSFSKFTKVLACTQAFTIITALSPAPTVFAAPKPDWHIARTIYNTNDYIVAGYDAKDFGIIANGKTDVTAKIQNALDALYDIGGGTLFLPSGKYAIKGTLKIPQGVTLAGDWQSPDKSDNKVLGTVLMAYSGKGYNDVNDNSDSDPNSLPFIILEPNSHVENLSIYYPEQSAENPVPYPTTIRMYDPRTWGADSTRISNITFVNSYNAIRQGPYSSGCPNVNNVYITPINTAIDIDGLTDVGRLTDIHISPKYWLESGLDNANENADAFCKYAKEHATGLRVGRIDWSYFSFLDIEGCNHGMEFALSHSILSYENSDLNGTMNAWTYPNGQVYDLNITDCNVGLYSEGCSGAGMLVAEADITDCSIGIQTVNGVESVGNLEISNSRIGGSEYSINHNGLIRMCVGNSKIDGNIEVQNSQISIAGAEYTNSTITLKDNSDKIYNKNGNEVTKSGNVILSGDNLPAVDNQNNMPVTYNSDTYIPPHVSSITESPVLETKPYKPDIFVVTDEKYNAPHNDAEFQSYNEHCAEDASAAIQKALDDAEQNGGGIVFCPPGRYTLKSQLRVAEGVELRGAIDSTRLPMKIGTIFDTPVDEYEFLSTSFTDLNTKTINDVENCLSGNTIFGEVPSPTKDDNNEIGRSITVTPNGLRLFSAAAAEQAHAFDHSTQLQCGQDNSKYVIEAIISPKSLKSSGEFFITLSRNEQSITSDGTVKNSPKDAFRIANFKADNNVLGLPGNVSVPFSNSEMYIFRWELDLTDINNKTIKTTVIGTKSTQNGEIYTSEAKFPDAYQGTEDNVGHILLQASKVSADKNPTGSSEVFVHGISVRRDVQTSDPAWVLLEGGSGINGITFNCIDQKFLPSPKSSPYMIEGSGDNIYVKNIALRNVYNGLDFKSNKCDNLYIDGVAGIAWNKEIEIADCDNAVLKNTQFNWGSLLYGSQTKLGCWEDSPDNNYTDSDGTSINPRGEICEPYMKKFLALNLDCITVDNCENILLFNNFSIFGANSLIVKGNTNGLSVGHGVDGSRFAIKACDNVDMDFVNTQLVSFYYSDSAHITTNENYMGRCDFLNTSSWSTPSVNICSYGGEIHMYNSTFNWVGKSAFSDLKNDAYLYLQSGWIKNSNSNYPMLTDGGSISFSDILWNAEYSSLPSAEKPDALPTPSPRAPLSPRPGNFEPLNPEITYSVNFGKDIEFNRIQLVWEDEQDEDVTVTVNDTTLYGTVNGKVLNILNGTVSTSEEYSKEEQYDLHTVTANSINIVSSAKPAVKLYKDENLQQYITNSQSNLPDGQRLFDGITRNPKNENLSNNWYVAQLYPFVPDTTEFEEQTARLELNDTYDISKMVMYTWGSDGWYPKSCTVSSVEGDTVTDSYLYESLSPESGNYPDYNPYVIDPSLNFVGNTFAFSFPEGGYSDINKPDEKSDGTLQYKFGFRIYEIELYGSKASVWSSVADPVYNRINVTKSDIPENTEAFVTYKDSVITDTALVVEGDTIEITAPEAEKYILSVSVNDEILTPNDNGIYTYQVNGDANISILYTPLYNVNVTKSGVPENTEVFVTYKGSVITDTALAVSGDTVEITAPAAEKYILSVSVNDEILTPNDNGIYTYQVNGDTNISIVYKSEKLNITKSDDGNCINISAENLIEADSSYNGILAIYDKSNILVYLSIQENCAADTKQLTYENINLDNGDYKIVLYRWKYSEAFDMTPLQVPLLRADYSMHI